MRQAKQNYIVNTFINILSLQHGYYVTKFIKETFVTFKPIPLPNPQTRKLVAASFAFVE